MDSIIINNHFKMIIDLANLFKKINFKQLLRPGLSTLKPRINYCTCHIMFALMVLVKLFRNMARSRGFHCLVMYITIAISAYFRNFIASFFVM